MFSALRGIRQGNPLSSYIFIIFAEVLSNLLLHADCSRFISSFTMGSGPLKVSYIFFIYDSIIFYKANSIKWSRMLSIIERYEKVSGQLLSKKKILSIFFGTNTPHEVKDIITKIVGTRAYGSLERYLELLTCLSQNKTKYFHLLLNKT